MRSLRTDFRSAASKHLRRKLLQSSQKLDAGVVRLNALSIPYNPVTRKIFTGFNALWLASFGRRDARWLTAGDALRLGAVVRDGEQCSLVETWEVSPRNLVEKLPVHIPEGDTEVYLGCVCVYNAEQCDGLPRKETLVLPGDARCKAQQLLERYKHQAERIENISAPSNFIATPSKNLQELLRAAIFDWVLFRNKDEIENYIPTFSAELRYIIPELILYFVCQRVGLNSRLKLSRNCADRLGAILDHHPDVFFRLCSECQKVADIFSGVGAVVNQRNIPIEDSGKREIAIGSCYCSSSNELAVFLLIYGIDLERRVPLGGDWYCAPAFGARFPENVCFLKLENAKCTIMNLFGTALVWRPLGLTIHPCQIEALSRKLERLRVKTLESRVLENMRVSVVSREIWEAANNDLGHWKVAYLQKKKIKNFGIRKLADDSLIIPIRAVGGTFKGLVTLDPYSEGYLGSNIDLGSLFLIDPLRKLARKRAEFIFVTAHYPTAAMIASVLGEPVAVTFEAHNMLFVASEVRGLHPDLPIFLASKRHYFREIRQSTEQFGYRKDVADYAIEHSLFFVHPRDRSLPETDDVVNWHDFFIKYGKRRTKEALKRNMAQSIEDYIYHSRNPSEVRDGNTFVLDYLSSRAVQRIALADSRYNLSQALLTSFYLRYTKSKSQTEH